MFIVKLMIVKVFIEFTELLESIFFKNQILRRVLGLEVGTELYFLHFMNYCTKLRHSNNTVHSIVDQAQPSKTGNDGFIYFLFQMHYYFILLWLSR